MTDRHATVTSAEVAALLRVSISYVYRLRATDPRFPVPTASPRRGNEFVLADVRAYVADRRNRPPSAPGRRPRTLHHLRGPRTFAERLRASVFRGDGEPEFRTQRGLARRLGLSEASFGHRMRGRTRWGDGELTVISELLRLDTSDANAASVGSVESDERVLDGDRSRASRPAGESAVVDVQAHLGGAGVA